MVSLFRILNVGPDPGVRDALRGLVQADRFLSLRHAETASVAFDVLRELADSDLPHLVIVPCRLPVLTCVDFITAVYSHPRLRSIPILVWGPRIRADEIDQIYATGAACVLPGPFSRVHLDAVRQLCHSYTGTEPDVPLIKPPRTSTRALFPTREKAVRNAKLGTLFVWTGCISAAFWVCAFFRPATSFRGTDLTPLLVYAALTYAGMSLLWRGGGAAGAQHRP
jgi:CheY-like chemotaxis protein